MTELQIHALILLLILAAHIGTIWFLFSLNRYLKSEAWANTQDRREHRQDMRVLLDRLSNAAERQRGMKQALLDDGKLTRERIAQVKTRLADEERVNQKELARARYERRRGGG